MKCKCGGKLFLESERVSGWWQSLLDEDGETVDTDTDRIVYHGRPKTVKCFTCGRRVGNPARRLV